MNNTISPRYHQLPIAIVLYFILKNNHWSFEYSDTVLKAADKSTAAKLTSSSCELWAKKWHWRVFSVKKMFLTYWLWQEISQTAWRINARHGVVTYSQRRLCNDGRPRAAVNWLLKNCIGLFECDKQSASKPCLPFRNAFYGLFIRWIQEMDLKGLGSDSSGLPGWSGLVVVLH